jgi:hypothetical protein
MKCDECGKKLEIGDYPFCGPSGHATIHSRNAVVAAPTVVFRNAKGEYRFPGRDTDKPPRGFQRVELSTQRSRDRFEREMNQRETQKLRDIEYDKKDAYARTVALHRDNLLRIKANSQSEHTKKFVDLCIADSERRMNWSIKDEAGFHLEHNHMDAQNRSPWNDKDTNWKDRR